MAGLARDLDVFTSQGIAGRSTVIEQVNAPVFWRMAGLALVSEFTAMLVFPPMAGDAGRGSIFMVLGFVAGTAFHIHVLAHQRILRFAVIEAHLLPALGDVTGSAILAE